MIGFLVGLIVAIIAAVSVYWYMFMQQSEVKQQDRGAATQVQINTNKIPQGPVMGEGTISE